MIILFTINIYFLNNKPNEYPIIFIIISIILFIMLSIAKLNGMKSSIISHPTDNNKNNDQLLLKYFPYVNQVIKWIIE